MKPRDIAKAHWEYTKGLLECLMVGPSIEVMEYLYIEAFLHGDKHGYKRGVADSLDGVTLEVVVPKDTFTQTI